MPRSPCAARACASAWPRRERPFATGENATRWGARRFPTCSVHRPAKSWNGPSPIRETSAWPSRFSWRARKLASTSTRRKASKLGCARCRESPCPRRRVNLSREWHHGSPAASTARRRTSARPPGRHAREPDRMGSTRPTRKSAPWTTRLGGGSCSRGKTCGRG